MIPFPHKKSQKRTGPATILILFAENEAVGMRYLRENCVLTNLQKFFSVYTCFHQLISIGMSIYSVYNHVQYDVPGVCIINMMSTTTC